MDDQIRPTTQDPATVNTPSDTPPAANSNQTYQPNEQSQAAPPATVPEQPKPKSKKIKLIVLLLVLVLIATAAALALNKIAKPQKTAVQTTKKSVDILKFGVTQPFVTDFYPKSASDILPLEVNNQIFEGLTQYQNGNQIVPDLAKSWTNPDNTTWTFKLLNGVKFHNGHPLAAQDVKASLDALQTTDYGKAYGGSIKSVKAVDTTTVQITTTTPDPLLPNELANLWIYDTTSATPNDPANGTGPYVIKPGTKLTVDSLQLVANNTYHGGQPSVKEVDFKFYSDSSSEVADLKQGKLDIADLGSKSAVSDLGTSNFKAYGPNNIQVYFIVPNTLKAGSPLQNLKVRKAIYSAIDPSALEKADGKTGTPANQLVPQDIPGFNPDIKRPVLNPTQAKADVAAAGFPNGFTVTFTYFAPHQALAAELQKELAPLGIKLTLDPQTVGSVLGKKVFSGGTDLFYFGYSSSLVDSSDVFQQLLVDTANYKNSQVDTLFSQSSTTFNNVARLKLLQQINQVAMDDAAVFPLFTPEPGFFAVKSNLVVQADVLANYSSISFWKVYAQ